MKVVPMRKENNSRVKKTSEYRKRVDYHRELNSKECMSKVLIYEAYEMEKDKIHRMMIAADCSCAVYCT